MALKNKIKLIFVGCIIFLTFCAIFHFFNKEYAFRYKNFIITNFNDQIFNSLSNISSTDLHTLELNSNIKHINVPFGYVISLNNKVLSQNIGTIEYPDHIQYKTINNNIFEIKADTTLLPINPLNVNHIYWIYIILGIECIVLIYVFRRIMVQESRKHEEQYNELLQTQRHEYMLLIAKQKKEYKELIQEQKDISLKEDAINYELIRYLKNNQNSESLNFVFWKMKDDIEHIKIQTIKNLFNNSINKLSIDSKLKSIEFYNKYAFYQLMYSMTHLISWLIPAHCNKKIVASITKKKHFLNICFQFHGFPISKLEDLKLLSNEYRGHVHHVFKLNIVHIIDMLNKSGYDISVFEKNGLNNILIQQIQYQNGQGNNIISFQAIAKKYGYNKECNKEYNKDI